jgi:hypothetical protein
MDWQKKQKIVFWAIIVLVMVIGFFVLQIVDPAGTPMPP